MRTIQGNRVKKPRQDTGRVSKPCCGTLNYIAECRGTLKKAISTSTRFQSQPDGVSRVRKYAGIG